MERLRVCLLASVKGPLGLLSTLLHLDDILLEVLSEAHLGVDDLVVDIGVNVTSLGLSVIFPLYSSQFSCRLVNNQLFPILIDIISVNNFI